MEINALVVDDSGIMRKMVMRSLAESRLAQFTFTEAQDGADALTKFRDAAFDMLFVDWNMPNMSGIDFVRQVRSESKKPVAIVMVTTESTMARIEEALDQVGVDSYVCKPFTTDVLRQKLAPLFEKLAESATKKGGFFSQLLQG